MRRTRRRRDRSASEERIEDAQRQGQLMNAMIINFHLPKSTLLMLVSAFAEKELINQTYAEATRERYRFYSFGYAMLIL